MIYQTDPKMPKSANKYACAFVSLAWYREKILGKPWTAEELSAAWTGAIAGGIISGDLNHDGDLDDSGEATILDWNTLATFLGCHLQYMGKYPLSCKEAVTPGHHAITAWTNPKNGFVHFVVGSSKPVTFDPIYPGSITIRDGHPMELTADGRGGIRLFKAV
jgi:hypothetical protein